MFVIIFVTKYTIFLVFFVVTLHFLHTHGVSYLEEFLSQTVVL